VSGPAEVAEPAPPRECRVRAASVADAPAAAAGVRELLVELGGTPPAADVMEAVTRELIEDPDNGAVLVAEAGGVLIGVLAASWPVAIHSAGRYGLIQDLWVDPAWRSRAIGRELLQAFFALAVQRGASRVEVGIPRDDFPRLEATRRFYLDNGFSSLGARLRWLPQ
jgi:GNAT superfamily N-acetyltransferase